MSSWGVPDQAPMTGTPGGLTTAPVWGWPLAEELDEEIDDTPSWRPLDLSAVLDGTHQPQLPTMLLRTDGHALVYPGCTHSFHGEPESGKSFVALLTTVEALASGGRVLYLDYESDAGTVVERLLALGASTTAIRHGLDYVRPDADPGTDLEAAEWRALLTRTYALAVIDGVTEALSQSRVPSIDNDAITAWMRRVARTIAHRTGAAVITVDHVTKDSEGRGRFAIGGQAKLAVLTGAAYAVDVVQPLVRGKVGVLSLRVAKDRPGQVRQHAGAWRKSDRTSEAARIVFDSTDPAHITVSVLPPGDPDGPARSFRPTHLMQRVCEELATLPEPPSGRELVALVHANRAATLTALGLLVAEGYVAQTNGPRGANRHRLVRAYREEEDPASDRFRGRNHSHPTEGSP